MQRNTRPHILEVSGEISSVETFQALARQRHCVFLDSAKQLDRLGRYSFVAADPFEVLVENGGATPLAKLGRRLDELGVYETDPSLPPFQGGAMGLIGYDLNRSLERILPTRFDEFQLPTLHFGLYDVVVAFDHAVDRAWLISSGMPEPAGDKREYRAKQRAEQFLSWLRQGREASLPRREIKQIPISMLSPAFETHRPDLFSNFARAGYERAVQRVIDYIHAGDVFQVNLAQRLLHPATTDSVALHLRMRDCNAAPFAAYYDLGDTQIISASPERFLLVRDGLVEARPIKGTRQRTTIPEADLFSQEALRASPKDLAENVMIVDLMRNDLSKVCDDDSVEVDMLCGLESYEYVQHLVSVVKGQLRKGATATDLVRATFPGGSITGAPKVRAMEIIAELEPTARGAYCGSLGYIGFDGTMDLNILIRTITSSHGWWQLPVGGGVVAQSDPAAEYLETWHKAEGMLRAI